MMKVKRLTLRGIRMSKESWNEFAAYYLPKVEACLQDYLSKLAA